MLQFSIAKRSILTVGDIFKIISDEEEDVMVLEKPECLTWHHPRKSWKSKFCLVSGIIHANFLEYVDRENDLVEAFFLKHVNIWVICQLCSPFESEVQTEACIHMFVTCVKWIV